jgi:oxygen-dependent protoporphyrinogen oxidase
MTHATIIGGGIAGLSTAYYLQKHARESGRALPWTLLEATPRLGGKIITERVEGEFTVEGGPDSFVTDKPWCLELCHELGLADQLIPSNELQRKVYILRDGRLVAFPSGFRLTIPTELKPFLSTPLISPLGKLRMAMDYFVPPREGDGDISLADFIGRRLGHECVDRIAGPLMAGIFVSDPQRLSMKGTFPRFLDMEKKHGSLIKAAKAARLHPSPVNPLAAGHAMFNSLRRGMGHLAESLAGRLEGDVRLAHQALGIQRGGGRLRVDTDHGPVETDAVVLALPAYHAARLVKDIHPDLSEQLAALRYLSTTTVTSAFMREDLPEGRELDGFGVLIPAPENRQIIACTWSSVKFRHRAPSGTFLLRAFIGGHPRQELAELPDDRIIALVSEEYRKLFGITAAPIFHRIYRWHRGNPQYDVGHLDRVAEMERIAAETPGLFLAGSAFHGIGMPDCIRSGKTAAQRIFESGA